MTESTLHWEEEASCRSLDSDLFFPVAGETVYTTRIAAIRQICASCPAANLCLEWALATGEPDGIWAGTTPGERRRLRAARRTPRPAADPAQPPTRKADAA
ncbi:WhiB family transcriptional regulator [Actinomadura sp. GTD37]|uniref:WhiB family transcriptional regulator n=1 Tax=Actinomadura sp. GTD37 TaxID=1778030 RepID=UPI0035BECEF3